MALASGGVSGLSRHTSTKLLKEKIVESKWAGLHLEYQRGRLLENEVDPNPLVTFATWFKDARDAELYEPNGMTLATVGANGHPSARVVLLRKIDERGFCFFTNYESRKGQELAQNPWAALVFWWGRLERQVRIEGQVEQLTEAESDAYYRSRPKGSRLGAWVSAQSQVIAGRQVLEEKLAALEAEYADREPERPPFWGGYRVVPTLFEFWQGGPHRLHDRLRYLRQEDGGWRIERLSP
jgi:pyridoxamine 5'-phosphate oxidase